MTSNRRTQMLYALMMAGGAGTRFWPVSRVAAPKQLLALAGPRTMIQATMDRLDGLCDRDQRLIITNRVLVDAVCRQLPEMPRAAILGEPCKRNTAPCVGLAALWVSRRNRDATMLVLPADHVIQSRDLFHSAMRRGEALIDDDPSRIVTFGIRPTYPAEVFGYIERDDSALDLQQPAAYHVKRFREKPSRTLAEEFVRSGNFYWNAGIFLWRVDTILNALAEFEPEIFSHLRNIAAAFDTPEFQSVFDAEFASINGKSIDYAVLERHKNVCVVEAPFDWDDVGNWSSLPRLIGSDADGNTVQGNHLGIDSTGCIVRSSPDHLVVTVGLEDCIVIHTSDATLVARREDEEKIRDAVKKLAERGDTRHL